MRLPVAAPRSRLCHQPVSIHAGAKAQLSGQNPLESAVLASRCIMLPRSCQQADHLTVGFLADRVGARRPTGNQEGMLRLPQGFETSYEAGAASPEELRQPLPLGEDPVVVVTGQQLAAIERQRV